MPEPTKAAWTEALNLIDELMRNLSVADPRATLVNQGPIQRATDFLEKHGRGSLQFPR